METREAAARRILLAFAVALEAAVAGARSEAARRGEPLVAGNGSACRRCADPRIDAITRTAARRAFRRRVRVGPLGAAGELRLACGAPGARAACLAVRVGATTRRDAWLARCAHESVPHAWFVDLEARWLERYGDPAAGRYRRRQLAYAGETLPLPCGAGPRPGGGIRVPALAAVP